MSRVRRRGSSEEGNRVSATHPLTRRSQTSGNALRREALVMLMSGADNGNLLVLNYGWAYIQKPFVAVKLVTLPPP
jgi:hypothetical protein